MAIATACRWMPASHHQHALVTRTPDLLKVEKEAKSTTVYYPAASSSSLSDWVLTILKSPQKSAIKCLGLEPSMTSSVSLLGVTVCDQGLGHEISFVYANRL